jgi:hypothetical protein
VHDAFFAEVIVWLLNRLASKSPNLGARSAEGVSSTPASKKMSKRATPEGMPDPVKDRGKGLPPRPKISLLGFDVQTEIVSHLSGRDLNALTLADGVFYRDFRGPRHFNRLMREANDLCGLGKKLRGLLKTQHEIPDAFIKSISDWEKRNLSKRILSVESQIVAGINAILRDISIVDSREAPKVLLRVSESLGNVSATAKMEVIDEIYLLAISSPNGEAKIGLLRDLMLRPWRDSHLSKNLVNIEKLIDTQGELIKNGLKNWDEPWISKNLSENDFRNTLFLLETSPPEFDDEISRLIGKLNEVWGREYQWPEH